LGIINQQIPQRILAKHITTTQSEYFAPGIFQEANVIAHFSYCPFAFRARQYDNISLTLPSISINS
jgi:hypothetical protein